MKLRPVDQSGDVLPVLHASDMFSGSLAVAKLVEDRLNLTYLSGYVRSTSGVKEVQDENWDLSGHRFSWSCTVLTEYGLVSIHSEF